MIRWILCLVVSCLSAETISTFYGPLEVEEPVLLELIHSPAMQRLKQVHQYGVSYYTAYREEFNRYDHSIGVFAVLRKNGASLEEQIAGLLHDVSHTVFSHVGDWIFGKENQEDDYQNTIHTLYLSYAGVEEILLKYGFTVGQVNPKNGKCAMLEQPLPNLSADRIDYNIQGAYHQNFLTKDEAIELFHDLQFLDGRWVATRKDLLKQITQFSLFMMEHCWGNAWNYVVSRWLADAMIRGLDLGLLSWREIHFGVDEEVWDKLAYSEDPFIKERMYRVQHPDGYYVCVDPVEATLVAKCRCRGVDPWVMREGEIVRLTAIDSDLASAFKAVQERAALGWPIKLLQP